MSKADDAVKRVSEFLQQYGEGFNFDDAIANIVGSGDKSVLLASDVATILAALEAQSAEIEADYENWAPVDPGRTDLFEEASDDRT